MAIPYFIHPTSSVSECKIGKGTKIWQFVVIIEGAIIGDDCNICAHVLIEGDVTIGNRVTIKSGVQLWNGMKVGNDVFIGPNATFTNDKYPISKNKEFDCLQTIIQDHAIIGAGAVILPGITIGERAIVGAGSVVTRDVPPGTTVIGNPANLLKNTNP
jgi:UDP-2-acetamido-3-amino-2,3-dideoxy-glucuronate N-acetyltransferase